MKKTMGWALMGIISMVLAVLLVLSPTGICASETSTLTMGWSEGPQAGMNPFLARNEGDYIFMSLM